MSVALPVTVLHQPLCWPGTTPSPGFPLGCPPYHRRSPGPPARGRWAGKEPARRQPGHVRRLSYGASKLGRVQDIAHGNVKNAPRPYPWPEASATGIGSMPGTDPAEAMRIIAGELPTFSYLPELPARGPGADLTGRTAALLVDMPVETTPRGWRLAERPGRDMRAARSMLSADLDALEEIMAGYSGPLKISICGPWTLAATIELPRRLDAILADGGAVAELAASLAEGAAAHAAEVARRVPGATLVLQADEPSLPAVAAGQVPTASGLRRLPAVETSVLAQRLATVLSATGRYTVVHCCAAPVPFGVIRAAGADAAAFDLSLLRRGDEDPAAEAADAGLGLLAGAIGSPASAGAPLTGGPAGAGAAVPGAVRLPGAAGAAPSSRATAERVVRFWRHLGMPPGRCAEQVVITPACGLAGTSPGTAKQTLAHCREAARIVPELAGETEGAQQ